MCLAVCNLEIQRVIWKLQKKLQSQKLRLGAQLEQKFVCSQFWVAEFVAFVELSEVEVGFGFEFVAEL